MTAPYSAPMQSIPQQAWQQPAYSQPQSFAQPPQQSYSQTQSPGQFPPRSSPQPAGIPYAYGQLPANANPKDPKSQHPIPGSYNRHAGSFNPKSNAFVPGPSGGSMVPLAGQGPAPSGIYPGSGSPQLNPQHMSYNGFQQPIPQQYPQGYRRSRVWWQRNCLRHDQAGIEQFDSAVPRRAAGSLMVRHM